MNANYSLSVWYELPKSKLYHGRWQCLISFAYPGLGNTGEGERIASNAIRSAKRAIRNTIKKHEAMLQPRNAYEVVANSFTLGTGQLKTLTIANKTMKGN